MKKLLLVILMCVHLLMLLGQDIQGIIYDSDNAPLPGAVISNISSGQNTTSDDQGVFMIDKTSLGDTLKISYLGYQTIGLVIQSLNQEINLSMTPNAFSLNEVIVAPELDATRFISTVDVQTNPINSSQEVLRQVPGLFIGQHAGGGKAEQLFLRGFDIDHGTDVNITVDGVPVNMVSHAHGQGYADLHFVIPETIERIDFGKGPYYADQGNFNTAGFVNLKIREKLEDNTIKLESGRFNTQRILGMIKGPTNNKLNSYVASEFISTDGPFISPQDFTRLNIIGRLVAQSNSKNKLSIAASHFRSQWSASGQIPQRAVESGEIERFGAIDDTEGGSTNRTNLSLSHTRHFKGPAILNSRIFYSNYFFELFSNFSFFLNDPINGDQIKQREKRNLYGGAIEYSQVLSNDNLNGNWKVGITLRQDESRENELSHTLNRTSVIDDIRLGDISETNLGSYVGLSLYSGNWTFSPSLRLDYFQFEYTDDLQPSRGSQAVQQTILNPKLNILFDVSDDLQFYLKTGRGFHSNDSRVVVARSGEQVLPGAFGLDAGLIWQPNPNLSISPTFWYLYLDQEFVYVGDEGIVEPSGRTKRHGLELNVKSQPLKWLNAHLDLSYAVAKSIDETKGSDLIPLAPRFTLLSTLLARHPSGVYGGLKVRYLGDRPATVDNQIIAEGYTVVDGNIGYQWKNMSFGLSLQNLFNVEWNETQFATLSRLSDEASPAEEIHFTPGTPLFIKAIVSYNF